MMTHKFLAIPAIDLMGGECVRLLQGKKELKTVYSNNPPEVAARWRREGAERLHVVDLDGAFEGAPKNLDTIRNICKAADMPIELGGGIRSHEVLAAVFDAGVSYAILGTAAIKDTTFLKSAVRAHKEKIIIGIDAKDGKVATEGWVNVGSAEAYSFAKDMAELGVKTIIFTDIKKDGMLTGSNLESLSKMAEAVPEVDIIASGGISSVDDLVAVKNLGFKNIIGAITGKALYEGKIDLREAVKRLL